MKTPRDGKIVYSAGDTQISNECAEALIRNGWVQPNRDGLGLFDESQTYRVLKPTHTEKA